MTIIQGQGNDYSPGAQPFWEAPFAETLGIDADRETEEASSRPDSVGFLPWTEDFSPFTEAEGTESISETETLLNEAYDAMRDEAFDEALGELLAEAEQSIADRFSEETPTPSAAFEKERIAENYLSPVRIASEQYLDQLLEALSGQDLESFRDEQLDEYLDRLDPSTLEVSIAGEDFVRGIIRKAKGAVKFVVGAAKKVGKVAGGLVLGALKALKRLVSPLLKRVLSFAIGRLPLPLQAPARLLSRRILGEEELELEDEYEGDRHTEDFAASPAMSVDPETLAESFDAALAEALAYGETEAGESETFDLEESFESTDGSRELEALAEARGRLITALQGARGSDDLSPAIEQFVPVLLAALRTGIRIVGRPRVVGFLAKYLAQLISKWVDPKLARPLSSAIVDTGLRLVSLEQEELEREDEAIPVLLANTIEDTVRGLAESEDYELEDEDLMHFAAVRSFERAVASNFPGSLVRDEIRKAPALGGRFVGRRVRSTRPYRRYNRAPEVEVKSDAADRVKTFGGITLGASLRAVGLRVPFKARIHIFQATVGTSLRRIASLERTRLRGISLAQLHPLTPRAAALLLREPSLGVAVPQVFLRSRQRVAAGQRFYYIEPLNAATTTTAPRRNRSTTSTPTQAWLVIDTITSRITCAFYFSEPDAQRIAEGVRAGRGTAALVPAITAAWDGLAESFNKPNGRIRIMKEFEEGEEFVGAALKRLMPVLVAALRKAIKSWIMPLITEWIRQKAAEFGRAAADPRSGVTVTVSLANVPAMQVVRQALNGQLGLATIKSVVSGDVFRGVPTGAVNVTPGLKRP
ncbi:hypothetical protein [Arthrobacter sp. Cr_A7]|uniref:hypothetical protein n=1 Tax=Arthrobacter sp. Cr_A7 TaxID=3031017 RepID=UPI0023DAF5FC|nr:hypothetical protein [Arthrobacter sp. Cr_A7]MDF2049534.1 hypothetical protein [Arthrobacter sp. Cr_A7]